MGLKRRKAKSPRRPWKGGYIRREVDGLDTYVIERQVGGHRFHVSTRCNDLSAALKQLERFEAEPLRYQPAGEGGGDDGEPLTITTKLADEYMAWCRYQKGNSGKYVVETGGRLEDWQTDLRGKDLRRVTLRDDLLPALARRPGAKHRIITIKAFYGWLRKVAHLLTNAQDPTLDLTVPQSRPEKHVRRKAVAWTTIKAIYPHLDTPYRDVLQLLAATGWHLSELERFIREDGSAIDVPPGQTIDRHGRQVLVVLSARHKSKKLTRTPLMEQAHVNAARRLREARVVPRRLNEAIAAAVGKANAKRRGPKLEIFTLGVMRHSVATWALELGATPEETADYLGHESKRTTMRFYADVAVPTSSIPTRVLTTR